MAPTATEQDPMGKGLKDLNLTNEELTKFEKAFKDPEFLKLFEEYAKEVSDPKAKAETDLYLRELEQQGRAEEVYGKGVQLVVPTAAMVLKSKVLAQKGATDGTTDDGGLPVGQKVFINICSSEKVDRYSLRDARDASGRTGQHLSIPLALGPKRVGADKKGNPAAVYDFIVHPDSVEFANVKPAVLSTLAETALEQVAKVSNSRLSKNWRRLNARYKGTEGCPEPPVQSIRTAEGGEAVGGRLRPQPNVPAVNVPGAEPAPNTANGTEAAAADEGAGKGASSRSNFSFDRGQDKPRQKAAASQQQQQLLDNKNPAQAGYRHADGAVTPEWTLVHRGEADLAAAWGDAGRGLTLGAMVPKELLVRVTLPEVTSVAVVDLDVGERLLVLKVPGRYHLIAPLPYAVDETKGKAKFDKTRKQMEITLPVVPPPPPPPRPAVTPVAEPASAGEQQSGPVVEPAAQPATTQAGDEDLEATAAATREPGCTHAAAESMEAPASGVDGPGAAAVETTSREADTSSSSVVEMDAAASSSCGKDATPPASLSENERRWREVHAQQQQPEAVEQAQDEEPGGTASQPGDGVGEAGVSGGADEAAADTAGAGRPPPSGAVVAEEAAPVVMLQPRLRRDLAMELD